MRKDLLHPSMGRRVVNLEPLQYRALWGGRRPVALTLTHADRGYNFVLKEKVVSRRIWAGKELMRVFRRQEIEGAILVACAFVSVFFGLKVGDLNYKLFLFLLAGVFALAIFRPKHSP